MIGVAGFFVAAVFKTVLLHHGIFSINSWAHCWGEATFNSDISPRDSVWCAIWTLGEGYHNFHHEFPNDYRNGSHFTAFDPTKWFIAALESLGLAINLKRHTPDQIRLCKLQTIQRKTEEEKRTIFKGTPIELLPYYSNDQLVDMIHNRGALLLTLDEIVYDVREFIKTHPGGKNFIQSYIGKDIAASFNGGVYSHSNAAKNLLQTLRCGRLMKQ